MTINEIYTVVYGTTYGGNEAKPKNMRKLSVKTNYGYVPDKRLYPEACDFEFCRLLKERGISLPFTVFNSERVAKDFYGFTLEDVA